MRIRHLLLLLCLVLPLSGSLIGCGRETAAEHAANVRAQQEMDAAPAHGNLPHYSLSPEKLAKAQHIAEVRLRMTVVGIVWSVVTFVLLLWLGWAAKLRDVALRASAKLREEGKKGRAFWRECLVFMLLLRLVLSLSRLPLSAYGHHLSTGWGFSVQGWGSWLQDWAISTAITAVIGIGVAALLLRSIRQFPRSWWLAFWLKMVPFALIAIFVVPVVYDPLFNKFEPLMKTNPELVQQLERVVAKGHMDIPPERMFLMKASSKVTTLNAYVTGFGASKRVVVWDTSLAKASTDEVLYIFGHESGHYVLNHVVIGTVSGLLALLVLLYLCYHLLGWCLKRYGDAWGIPAQNDWAVVVVLMFFVTVATIVFEPVQNTVGRAIEHAADVYGQEAVHGIVADPQGAAQRSFQVLGENSLDEPNTPHWEEIWLEDHPSIGRRAAFAAFYDPWAEGVEPKYFSK